MFFVKKYYKLKHFSLNKLSATHIKGILHVLVYFLDKDL